MTHLLPLIAARAVYGLCILRTNPYLSDFGIKAPVSCRFSSTTRELSSFSFVSTMSVQTLLFGYDEPHVANFVPGSDVHPRAPGASRTTHSFTIPVNKHTSATLRLFGSHSPEDKLRPLYYAPCLLEGEVVLEIDKREDLNNLGVSVSFQIHLFQQLSNQRDISKVTRSPFAFYLELA